MCEIMRVFVENILDIVFGVRQSAVIIGSRIRVRMGVAAFSVGLRKLDI